MKTLVKLLIVWCMLIGFGYSAAANSASTETTDMVTYTINKGDSLTKIAKKFPGTTWRSIAKTNNIANANLIYANTTVRLPVMSAKTATTPKVHIAVRPTQAVVSTPAPEATCDVERGITLLHYPSQITTMIEESLSLVKPMSFSDEHPFFIPGSDADYTFSVSPRCVYTKIVRMHAIAVQTPEVRSGRDETRASTTMPNLSPPEPTPGHANVLQQRQDSLITLIRYKPERKGEPFTRE